MWVQMLRDFQPTNQPCHQPSCVLIRPFSNTQMNLLDRAIKLAAEQDEPLEMNFVRKHALQQAEDLGVSVRDAATRVFSNASGRWGLAELFWVPG